MLKKLTIASKCTFPYIQFHAGYFIVYKALPLQSSWMIKGEIESVSCLGKEAPKECCPSICPNKVMVFIRFDLCCHCCWGVLVSLEWWCFSILLVLENWVLKKWLIHIWKWSQYDKHSKYVVVFLTFSFWTLPDKEEWVPTCWKSDGLWLIQTAFFIFRQCFYKKRRIIIRIIINQCWW